MANTTDLRKYASQTTTASQNAWLKAGYARVNQNGEAGANISINAYVTFDEKGAMVLKIGGKDSDKTIKIAPDIRGDEGKPKTALYQFAGTTVSVGVDNLLGVIGKQDGAWAVVNTPKPKEFTPPAANAAPAAEPAHPFVKSLRATAKKAADEAAPESKSE